MTTPGVAETAGSSTGSATIVAACLGAAVAVWLVPASIEIVRWAPGGPIRVGLFAPLLTLGLALSAAVVAIAMLLLVGARARESRAARARIVAPLCVLWLWTVPYLPWLPDRAPVLLILAGPVRWLVASASLGGVVGTWAAMRNWRPRGLSRPARGSLFVVTLILYSALGLRSLATVGLGGDEPHYLVITHSLLVDRDLEIENNHARADYHAFFPGDLRPDYLRRGLDGEIYSIHAPGLPVLLLPAYGVAGARGAVITMCALAALATLAVYDIALLIGGPTVARLTWMSISLTVPFLPHAWMVYPETAAAAIGAWAALWLMSPLPERSLRWVVRGACLALLPWLHTKFIALLGVLAVLAVPRLRTRMKDAAAFAIPIAMSLAAWLAYFWVIYGSIDPQVPYGTYTDQYVRSENIPRSLLGILIDQKFGLLIYSPVYLLAVVGVWFLVRDRAWRSVGLAAVAAAIPYVLGSSRLYMWWGGSSAPARFLVPIVPLAAPAIAAVLVRASGRVARATFAMCVAFSVIVAVATAIVPERLLLFSTPHGVARLLDTIQGSAPVTAMLPTFTEENWTTPLTHTVAWIIAATVALGLAGLAARSRRCNAFWVGTVEATAFVVVGSLLAAPAPASARAETVTRGRIGLMNAYDPDRLRGFDYGMVAGLEQRDVLGASALTLRRSPGAPVDELGRVAGPVALPPGRYEARVWFSGPSARDGDLFVSPRLGNVLARASGPLANPTTLVFDMPVQVPLWIRISPRASAEAVQQVEIVPVSITPKSRRLDVQPRAIEAIVGRSNAYIVYVNDETYPEGGVFWTRAANRGDVVVAPAGASQIVLTLFGGPAAKLATLEAAGHGLERSLRANETDQVIIPVPAGATLVPISVQASEWFRPFDVDSGSTDTRRLGCQVRVELR